MYINSNLCKNMYLEQESQDTNLFSRISSVIPAVVFYSMFGYIKMIIKMIHKMK
jgi:hypothetical protein